MSATRNITVSHQILSITDINFVERSFKGFTELHIASLNDECTTINLNCKQCKIYSVFINGTQEDNFEYYDPLLAVNLSETENRQDLQGILADEDLVVIASDADLGNGELIITLSEDAQKILKEKKILKIGIEFSLENPKGGIQFVSPSLLSKENQLYEPHSYFFTCDNNSSMWFPCVMSYSEPCTWKIEVTAAKSFQVIASGDFIEKKACEDQRNVTHHFFCSIPTCAPNIGLAVGQFESVSDKNMSGIVNYCLPQFSTLLKNCTSFLHEIIEFYEEYLSVQYPYSSYKQIYVDNVNADFISFSTITILNISQLHPSNILDQMFALRKLLSSAVSEQFFGCFVVHQSLSDWWLVAGISSFLSALYFKKAFGNNEYRYMVYQDMKEICKFERELSCVILDFNYSPKDTKISNYPIKSLSMLSTDFLKIAKKKSHLVVRLIEDAIGTDIMAQMLNKLLSLASNAASQKFSIKVWNNMLISSEAFLRLLATVTAKDIKPLLENWVHKAGVIRFNGSYTFNRKKNMVEIDLKQDMANSKGYRKYVGPLNIIIQEFDGSFIHTIQIEENNTKYDVQCHSKIRKNKKKKIPLSTGEEVDIELSQTECDSPVLWMRIDHDMKLIREIRFEQPDHHWQNELKHERDICAQLDAIETLKKYPSVATRHTLTAVVENSDLYYQVRIHAAYALVEVANQMVHTWNGPLALLASFKKIFMSHACPQIVKCNNFSDPQYYFIQKNLPIAMASLRNAQNVCPNEVIKFILDLIRFNENSKNRFSDCYYRAALIDALSGTISTAIASSNIDDMSHSVTVKNFSQELRSVIEEIVLRINLEKLTPSYRFTVTISCLKALKVLQKLGHIPENMDIFLQYTKQGVFDEVRKTALEILIAFFEVRCDEETLDYLLNFVENDQSNLVKHHIVQCLFRDPDNVANLNFSNLSYQRICMKIRDLINKTLYDLRLRADLMELYYRFMIAKEQKL